MIISQEQAVIFWDGQEDVMIKVPETYRTKPGSNHRLYGLCGTFDGKSANDFSIMSGTIEKKVNEFAQGWKAKPLCTETQLSMPKIFSPGVAVDETVAKAESACSVIEQDAFAPCFSVVPVKAYKTQCMKDYSLCNYTARSDCVCNSLTLYSRACQEKNVTLKWRTSNLCRKFKFYHWH